MLRPATHYFILLGLLLLMDTSHAASGDTTTVYVHNSVDMTWYGNYDEQAIFPTGNTNYRKVLMTYTLGCASGGCSDWDYTTQILFRRPTGQQTIDRIDTISTMPLVLDTVWREVVENMELGRVITPYGTYMANSSNGYNNGWKHRYYFDVTDYVHLLKDTCDIRAFYSGWSSGFSVSLRFDFIEGNPPRDILSIQNIYNGSKSYANSNDFETTYFTSKQVMAPSNASNARVFSTITGHGFDNNVNCAEFCVRQYRVQANSTTLGTATIWKDDCGKNPIYPQGGTWVYNRAGWCPGSKADIHEFEWTNFNAGASNSLDFQMQNYTWSGNQAPSYTVDAHVVFYGNNNYTNDVELLEVLRPNDHEKYGRLNPFCGNPLIRVKNNGSAPITTLRIEYGLNGAAACSYLWTGSIPFLGEQEIELPTLSWQGANTADPKFNLTITQVNGVADEYVHDNSRQTTYEVPEVFNTFNFLLLGVRTNNNPNETSYTLTDASGNIVFQRTQGSMMANTTYKDSLFLADGCYHLQVKDSGNDGLSWWANTSQGGGSVAFYSPVFTFATIKTFNADFGSEMNYYFVWNTVDSVQSACNLLTNTSPKVEIPDFEYQLYPNPSTGLFTLELGSVTAQSYRYTVYNLVGQSILQGEAASSTQQVQTLDLSREGAGMYILELETANGERFTEQLVVVKE